MYRVLTNSFANSLTNIFVRIRCGAATADSKKTSQFLNLLH